MALHVLSSMRAGLESTRGTPVTPTRLIYYHDNGATHTQDVGTIMPSNAKASYEPFFRAYPGLERNTIHVEGDWTFTSAYWWLNLCADAEASGTVTDTSAYTWTFLPVHTSDALKSATIQFAWTDLLSVVGWSLPGCLGNKLTVTWTKSDIGGPTTGATFAADLITAYSATQITAFTGALSDYLETYVLGTQTKTYVNGTGSAFGTTADTKINQATFELDNGYSFRDGFDGTGTAVEVLRTKKRMSKLTVQRYFADTTELTAYLAKTARRIRVIDEGSVIGATTAKYTSQLDFSGVPNTHAVANVDDMVYANIEYQPIDDATLTSDFKWTVINTQVAAT